MNVRENPTRMGSPPIKVLAREERWQIEAKANAVGQSLSVYLVTELMNRIMRLEMNFSG